MDSEATQALAKNQRAPRGLSEQFGVTSMRVEAGTRGLSLKECKFQFFQSLALRR